MSSGEGGLAFYLMVSFLLDNCTPSSCLGWCVELSWLDLFFCSNSQVAQIKQIATLTVICNSGCLLHVVRIRSLPGPSRGRRRGGRQDRSGDERGQRRARRAPPPALGRLATIAHASGMDAHFFLRERFNQLQHSFVFVPHSPFTIFYASSRILLCLFRCAVSSTCSTRGAIRSPPFSRRLHTRVMRHRRAFCSACD